MTKLGIKKIVIISGVIILTVLLIVLFREFLPQVSPTSSNKTPKSSSLSTPSPSDKPQIVSTKPDPLNDTIISSTEVIEITFNRSLENVGEFKLRIEPKTEVKVELSGDRKTARIIPEKPYELGSSYSINIGPDSKFDGVGNWGESKNFHFKTIKYSGV